MSHVVVIGCGVVGAAIAYELSRVPDLSVTVIDKQPPARGATGAALGVLMGVISHKIKGRAWQMRFSSIQRYETLIPELEAITGLSIPFNRQGLLMLLSSQKAGELAEWEKLAKIRHSQGWQLDIWDVAQTISRCPQLQSEKLALAIYSPQDRQIDPTALTSALVAASVANGVVFKFGTAVVGAINGCPSCQQIQTTDGPLGADWFVIAAGLGSNQFTSSQLIGIKPVLGQALHLRLSQPLGHHNFQPVITGDDVHIVPVGEREYWVGATVEFPSDINEDVVAVPERLNEVLQQAIAWCPALAPAEILRKWSGLRPRPTGRPAPVIEHLPGYSNVLLATGHYRNGVLLAPATAQAIRQMILSSFKEQ